MRFPPVLAVAIALLALALACGTGTPQASGPANVVETFYDALNAGRYDDAKAHYDADVRGQLAGDEDSSAFAEWAKMETKNGSLERIAVLDSQVGETTADIDYEIRYRDGSRVKRRVTLTLEGGTWKMGFVS